MSAFKWAIIAVCVWGIVPILEKLGLAKVEPVIGLFYRCIGVFIGWIFLAVFIVKPAQIKAVDIRSAFLLIISGFLASFAAQIAFYKCLKLGDVSKFVPITGSYPLIAFILGIIILGETLTATKITGMVLIVAGIWALKIG